MVPFVLLPSCPVVDERVAHLTDDGVRILTLKFCQVEEVSEIRGQKERHELNVASITLISVAVVSRPVNAHQSLTTSPTQ